MLAASTTHGVALIATIAAASLAFCVERESGCERCLKVSTGKSRLDIPDVSS
jgi:hypothetical protein